MFRLLTCLLLLFVNQTLANFGDPVTTSSITNQVKLSSYLEYNIGSSDLHSPPIEGWSQLTLKSDALGFSQQVHWFRFKINNNQPYQAQYYLEIASALLDHAVVYTLSDGVVENVQSLGDQQDFNQRPITHEHFVVPISFNAGQQKELYVAIKSSGLIEAPMILWDKDAFQNHQSWSRLLTGVFLGFTLTFVLGFIVLSLIGKGQIYLFDALFVGCVFMIIVTTNGLGFHYLWPGSPAVQQHALYLFVCLAITASAVLAKHNLLQYHSDHSLIKGFNFIALSSLVIFPLCLLVPYQFGIYLIVIASGLITLAHFAAGVISYHHGMKQHQEFNIALVPMALALFMIVIKHLFSLSLPVTNSVLLQIALILQIALFILFNLPQRAVIEETTSTEQNTNKNSQDIDEFVGLFADQVAEESDDAISDNTTEVYALKSEIAEMQRTISDLKQLNTLDALSGIHNRRHFDKRLLAELRRSRRELSPLSLIMFDIDHFKKVNDNYGHLAGDEVIRYCALTASEQLNRPSDEIFRYGGEEFAVILANTDEQGAIKVAERIRKAIEELAVHSGDVTLNVTVSLGLCSTLIDQHLQPQDLIKYADDSLYTAKQQGRNQSQVYNFKGVSNGAS